MRQDTAPAELAPFDGVDASLSPLSKHLAEHQRREDASRMTLTQQQALLQQQWEQNHAQDFRNDQLLRSKTENPAGTRNRNRRHPRTDRDCSMHQGRRVAATALRVNLAPPGAGVPRGKARRNYRATCAARPRRDCGSPPRRQRKGSRKVSARKSTERAP